MYRTLDKVRALIDQAAAEDGRLDFKDGRALDDINDARGELVKDVTAFANAGGGTIVYGLGERQGCIADRFAHVTNTRVTKDRLTEIIQSNTDPPLRGFRIEVLNDPPKGRIIVIEVDEGDTAYQNRIDKRFYHRIEATSLPMQGFAIRDVMNRRTAAIVEVRLDVHRQLLPNDVHSYVLTPYLKNVGTRTAHYWILNIDTPITPRGLHQIPALIMDRGQVDFDVWSLRRYEYSSDRPPPLSSLRLLPSEEKALHTGAGFAQLNVVADGHALPDLLRKAPPIRMELYVDDARKQTTMIAFDSWF